MVVKHTLTPEGKESSNLDGLEKIKLQLHCLPPPQATIEQACELW